MEGLGSSGLSFLRRLALGAVAHLGASRTTSRCPCDRLSVYRARPKNGPRGEEDAPSVLPSGDHPRLGWLPFCWERASPASRVISNKAPLLHTNLSVSLQQSLTRTWLYNRPQLYHFTQRPSELQLPCLAVRGQNLRWPLCLEGSPMVRFKVAAPRIHVLSIMSLHDRQDASAV